MMQVQKVSLLDWLDDLCVRFIINLPQEELESVERICFQVEEAQWFYEDFIRPLDPSLPSMNLRKFCSVIFQHCPLLSAFSPAHHEAAFAEFLAYKTRVPVRGAIMLNEAMTEVVLVKGWKKGARWSFPRGKINKDESDLDCAIREVYEETGFDIKAAGLVDKEGHTKSIEVSMREQHMRLFVFRGVPMDTNFEPRTRKEISAIQWYKLSELPTLKQARQQSLNGEEMQLHSNKFYMVAPFLGPLKQWTRELRKRERLGTSKATVAAMPTDDEAVAEKAISDVAAILTRAPDVADDSGVRNGSNGDGHLDRLFAGLRASSRTTETPPNIPPTSVDPADALKRMLSIGQPQPLPPTIHAPPMPEVVAPIPQDPLLAILRSTSSNSPQPSAPNLQFPQTPLEQVLPMAPEPLTPPHHNRNRPPQVPSMARPPSFPFSPPQQLPQQQHPQTNMPSRLQPQGHASQLLSLFRGAAQDDNFAQRGSPMAPSAIPPRGFGDMPPPQRFVTSPPPSIVPRASQLPPPRLNAHTMSLLNAFKNPSQLPASPFRPHGETMVSELSGSAMPPAEMSTINPPSGNSNGSPAFAQTTTRNPTGLAPKPTSNQQSTLLSLFKSASPATPSRPLGVQQEPVELAAQLSPRHVSHLVGMEYPKPELGWQNSNLSRPPWSEAKSATVTGPLHLPTFEYLRNQQRQNLPTYSNGNDYVHDQMPVHHHPQQPQQAQRPNLDVAKPNWPPPTSNAPEVTRQVEAPKPVSFTILQRPSILDNPTATAPTMVLKQNSGNAPDRRGSHATDQQYALLSLLTSVKRSNASPKPTPHHNPILGLVAATTPGLRLRSASGLISPVSPLPASGLSQDSPSAMEARSRISSIGSVVGGVASVPAPMLAPAGGATSMGQQQAAERAANFPAALGRSRITSGLTTPTMPVDKNALLGFLEGVVQGAGR